VELKVFLGEQNTLYCIRYLCFGATAEISQVNEVIHAKKTEVYEKEDAMKGRCSWEKAQRKRKFLFC
jgi:hypothetical protein